MSASDARSTAFDQLHPALQKWVWDQGWPSLRNVQEASIPPILRGGRDVLIAAATAGGKTEAAFLPALTRAAAETRPGVRVLGVIPLKALINDQGRRVEEMAERLELPVHRWHGDVSAARKALVTRTPSGVLLITPESLEAMFVRRGTRLRHMFGGLVCVIVDELHAFVGSERGRQLQSLLHRLEYALGRRIDRIAMSATLGDMGLAASFLRPRGGADVEQIVSSGEGAEVQIQLRGYVGPEHDYHPDIVADLYRVLRGRRHLVFINRKSQVEAYAAELRERCERDKVPNEFYPHHGSLSKELREDAERKLQQEDLPTIVVSSSTLELGIDIGSVESVAQVGSPVSVASMRQRLGRSGRRTGVAVLRTYIEEAPITPKSPPPDALRWELVETIAMVELLVERWIEPPDDRALHLSTLVQQTMSAIAQYGGRRADWLWSTLCESGPFDQVDPSTFALLLRALAHVNFLTQTSDGILLLGETGERIVNHYDFYAAFEAMEEYRIEHEGRVLGALPILHALIVGGMVTFGGRRWVVLAVDEEGRRIQVAPAPAGPVPRFFGGGAPVHDRVRQKMFEVYSTGGVPGYLNLPAVRLLAEGRGAFNRLGLMERAIVEDGPHCWAFPWSGDRTLDTVAAFLQLHDAAVDIHSGCLLVNECSEAQLVGLLGLIARDETITASVVAEVLRNKVRAKWDRVLTEDLLCAESAVRDLDVEAARRAIARVLAGHSPVAG